MTRRSSNKTWVAEEGHPDFNRAMAHHHLTDTPKTLLDFHFVVPMPRAILPRRVIEWCRENCAGGWLVQYPRMGLPTFKNTVILFELEVDVNAFRDRYSFDEKYHKRPTEGDWEAAVTDNR